MKFIQHKLFTPILLFLLLVVTCVIYSFGLTGDFIFDDFINIASNSKVQLSSFSFSEITKVLSSGVASFLGRPLSMLSFGLNYYLTSFDPYFFKLTNIGIHLASGLGVYLLSNSLLSIGLKESENKQLKIQALALLITACWILHPLNVSTVLYIVQRMTLLSALVTIYTLLYYCNVRQAENTSLRQAFFSLGIISGLIFTGVLCKENAILIIPFILVIEIFFFHFKTNSAGQKSFLKLFLWLLVALPACLALILFLVNPDAIIGGYEARTFTLWERLLTQTRIIWMYIGWVLMPATQHFTFYYDDFSVSQSLLSPLSTLYASVGLAALSGFIIYFRKSLPWLCFGLAFFLLGHALESTILPLELVFEHRNYLPGFGLLFGVITTLLNLPKKFLSRKSASVFLALFLLFLAQGTYLEAKHWSNTPLHLASLVEARPQSHRINYSLAHWYYRYGRATENVEYTAAARKYFLNSAMYNTTKIRGHVGSIIAESELGMSVSEDIVAELIVRIQTLPLTISKFYEISKLTECHYLDFCNLDKYILIQVYNAIADNTLSPISAKQGFLDQIATSIYLNFNSTADGLGVLYLSQSLNNTLSTMDLKIIQMEIETGNLDAAKAHALHSKDKISESVHLISALEERAKLVDELIKSR